jgi:hypothetical membrane protein
VKSRRFSSFGVLAPIVYAIAVILGGAMSPGYSHASRCVSDLIGVGAPNAWLLNPHFGLYNLLVLGFGLGMYLAVPPAVNPRKRLWTAAAGVLLLQGLFGTLTLFFPEDPIGTRMTTTGTVHIVMAGLSSLTTMACMLLLGLWFRGRDATKRLALYSFISVGFVFVTGGLTGALGFAAHSPVAGLLERLTIGGFLQWLFVTALILPGASEVNNNA